MLLIVIGVIIAVVARSLASAKEDRANRADRGQQIATLFRRLERQPDDDRIERSLFEMLAGEPVGYDEQLVVPGGWFHTARPVLSAFARDPKHHSLLAWFFTCFAFPAGQQSDVLSWLQEILAAGVTDPIMFSAYRTAVDRLISNSAASEAMWLYQRILDGVSQSAGDPRLKAEALRIGRIAHAKGRADGRATVYDEEAMANDIAARIPQPPSRF